MSKKIEIKIMARITRVANKMYQKSEIDLFFKMEESTYSTDKKQFARIRNGTKKITAFLKPLLLTIAFILLLFLPVSSTEYPIELKNAIELISPII